MSIRFGLGNPMGMGSNSWHVRTGTDGSIYIMPRMLKENHRGTVKVSLHPKLPDGSGGRWKMEFQDKYVAQRPDVFETGEVSPIIDEWDSESVRFGSESLLREGFAVVLGRFSLGPHMVNENPEVEAEETKYVSKVNWERNLPDPKHAYQWTVIVGDPDVAFTPPGTRSLGATVEGVLNLGSNGMAYVMRHLIPVTDSMLASMKEYGEKGVAALNPERGKPTVIRSLVHGGEPSGLRWAMEMALIHAFDKNVIEGMLAADMADP